MTFAPSGKGIVRGERYDPSSEYAHQNLSQFISEDTLDVNYVSTANAPHHVGNSLR